MSTQRLRLIRTGRVHAAVISGCNEGSETVTVEWFENNETKGTQCGMKDVGSEPPELRAFCHVELFNSPDALYICTWHFPFLVPHALALALAVPFLPTGKEIDIRIIASINNLQEGSAKEERAVSVAAQEQPAAPPSRARVSSAARQRKAPAKVSPPL